MESKILEIKKLEKKYNGKFSLFIDYLYAGKDKILTIIGPNGAGKSTLIRLINLLEKPDKGSIYFESENICKDSIDKVRARKKMAVVFQEPLLFNTTVYKNILLGIKIRNIKKVEIKERLDYLVSKLKLKHLLQRSALSLSGGEQQKVALTRALILEPKLMLLDEPLANIDQPSREELRQDLFEVIRKIGRSTIYVTHDRNEAMILADDVAVINSGKIEQFGKKEEIFTRPKNEFVARFVGVETLLDGIVLKTRNNVCEVKINKEDKGKSPVNAAGINTNLKLHVVAKAKKGQKVILAIRPENVILYDTDMIRNFPTNSIDNVLNKNSNYKNSSIYSLSSAMNMLIGKITDIKDVGILKKVEIDCGFNLISFVTKNSVDRLKLKKGKIIAAAVKASSIHLLL